MKSNGVSQFTSCFGTILSLMILIVISLYALMKFEVMRGYGDTTYQSFEEINVRGEDDVVDYDF